jgi:putative tryptophan/tyrosine transport system substrate-binding protein
LQGFEKNSKGVLQPLPCIVYQRLYLLKMMGICICLLAYGSAVSQGAEKRADKVLAIVSHKIRPYMEALDAMEETVLAETGIKLEVLFLDTDSVKSRDEQVKRIAEKGDTTVFIAVGPEAAYLLWSEVPASKGKKIYTMVLNPESTLPFQQNLCGISLNIPMENQLRILTQVLPSINRIGLIYNPEHNAAFATQAVQTGANLGVTIVPLEVGSRKEIPRVLQHNWQGINGLWMIPDPTVIAESLVPFIIKESLSKGVPVIGFNRYFYENGASLCYLFDYKEIGQQTGRLLMELMKGTPCLNRAPDFKVWCNIEVLKALGVSYRAESFIDGRIGPGP